MKTLIDIPVDTLSSVQKTYHLKTKKAAIIFALNEVLRYHKLKQLAALSGTFADDEVMSADQLKRMRQRDTSRNIRAH